MMAGSTPQSWESGQTQRVPYCLIHETLARVDSSAAAVEEDSHRNPSPLLSSVHILVSPHRILLFESCREIRSMRSYKTKSQQTRICCATHTCLTLRQLRHPFRSFKSCLHVLQPVLTLEPSRRVFCGTGLPSSVEPEPPSIISWR